MMFSAVIMRLGLSKFFFYGCSKLGIRRLETEKLIRFVFGFASRSVVFLSRILSSESVVAFGYGEIVVGWL